MGIDHFISRRPACRPCPRCRCLMLTGIDEGVPYRVDIIPLNIHGEMAAWLTGRRTYGLHSGYVCYRSCDRMRLDTKHGRPAVLADHRCGVPFVEAADLANVTSVMHFVERIRRRLAKVDEKEEEALYSIGDLLSGKVVVIDDDGTAPF